MTTEAIDEGLQPPVNIPWDRSRSMEGYLAVRQVAALQWDC